MECNGVVAYFDKGDFEHKVLEEKAASIGQALLQAILYLKGIGLYDGQSIADVDNEILTKDVARNKYKNGEHSITTILIGYIPSGGGGGGQPSDIPEVADFAYYQKRRDGANQSDVA